MFRIVFFCYILQVSFTSSLRAQNSSDTITLQEKLGFGYEYFQGGKQLSSNQFIEIVEKNESSKFDFRIAKKHKTWGIFTSAIGAAGIGWTIGSLIAQQPVNWIVLASGVGFYTLGMRFMYLYDIHLKRAVEMYNTEVEKSESFSRLGFGISDGGIGFVLSF